MRFTFTVEVEVQRNQGKFASRDDIAQEIQDALEGADPGSMSVGENGEYETCGWDVSEQPQPKPARKPRAKKGTLSRAPLPAVDPDLDGARLQAVVDNAAREAASEEG